MTAVSDAPSWDLTGLYADCADPRLAADLAAARTMADDFARHYRGRSATLDATALATAIAAYEAVGERARRPAFYASLAFSADTGNEAAKQLLDRTREVGVQIGNVLTFFEIELKDIADDRYAALMADPALATARHWLDAIRRLRPHTLSEAEEQVIARKNLTGRDALAQLFDELSSALRFTVDGKDMSGEEVLALLHEPDAARRERAYTVFLDTYASHGVVWAGLFNGLLQDHRLECELRHFPDVVTPTHLENEVRAETVEAMMQATERHYGAAQDYFRLKAQLLGLPKLKNTDLYAPLAQSTTRLTFREAQELVVGAYAAFSPKTGALARDFFERGWIDAAIRPNKRLGAFCAALSPTWNPYVLMSYSGTPRDVATLAHELGHGIHDRLASDVRPLDYHPPLTLAETASTFGEMVLTRALLAREARPEVRRELLCAKIEDTIATVFRQNVLTRFEMAAHAARRDGPVSAAQLGDLWWNENAKLYGDAVEMVPAYRWGWSYIPHFIHSRFYCYSYVFGELLVLALYRQYQEEGAPFVPRYLELLASGGSAAPDVALAPLGAAIDDPAFWERGFTVFGELVTELRATL